MLAALGVTLGASPLASVDLAVSGLRSTHGLIQICVTPDPAHFPGCTGDPAARHMTVAADKVAAGGAGGLRFADLPSGTYAIALFHDENGNGRIDTRFGIPIEGVGFSNNPRMWFGPPSFSAARFAVTNRPVGETVKLKYFL